LDSGLDRWRREGGCASRWRGGEQSRKRPRYLPSLPRLTVRLESPASPGAGSVGGSLSEVAHHSRSDA
jgi:hypothetical protein